VSAVKEAQLHKVERVVVHPGEYHDPVTLMKASDEARARQGVMHVAAGMGDRLNLHIIETRHGYELDGGHLGPNDLVIAVRAATEDAADGAIAAIERTLAARRGGREVAGVGRYAYAGELRGQDSVEPIDWEPGVRTDVDALAPLAPHAERIARANDAAVARMQDARPLVVGIGTAGDLLPEMSPRTFLHAGPPIAWADMSGPMRGAVIGAVLLEGLASDPDDAVRRAKAGEFEFGPGHERGALGPMAGVISRSMPVWIVENEAHGNRSHCTLSEGLGGPFRFGAYDESVLERLRWMRSTLAPILRSALERLPEPLDLRAISAAAVQMGDEVHNRNHAASSLFFRALAPALVETDAPSADVVDVARYLAGDDFFYLNLSMASGKATADAASGIEHSSIVTAMARNGTEFGLRVSGTGGRWFTGPSSEIRGLYLPGYGREDANRDMGDSTITETIGLGGFAWAGAPSIIAFAGLSAEDALRATLAMYEITWSESVNYRIPALGYRGTPLGIDCRKVVETGVLPVADTGIAHKDAGVGIIGGGFVRPPMAPFAAAVSALGEAT
jgi:Protein of unknown function (DUF1116)